MYHGLTRRVSHLGCISATIEPASEQFPQVSKYSKTGLINIQSYLRDPAKTGQIASYEKPGPVYTLPGKKYLNKLESVPQVAHDRDTYTTSIYRHNMTRLFKFITIV